MLLSKVDKHVTSQYFRDPFSYFRPLMKQKLEQGINLVVDRYAFSGVAFTSAKPVSVFCYFKTFYQRNDLKIV